MEYFSSASSSSSSSSSLAAHFNGKNKKKTSKRSSSSSGNNSTTTSSTTVKLSTDPQSVAARERRHRISDRFKILQSLVPGGSKMDTVSMLEEAINYVKFLKTQIMVHQTLMNIMDDNDNDNNYVNLPTYEEQPQQQFNPTTCNNLLLDPNYVEPYSVSDHSFLIQGEDEEAAAMYYHLLGKN